MGKIRNVSEAELANGSVEWETPVSGIPMEKSALIETHAYNDVTLSACCRLAPIELYQNRPFSSGAYYEEIDTAAGFVVDVDNVTFVDTTLYAYVKRDGSIVQCTQASFKLIEDLVVAIDDFVDASSWDKNDPARIYFECLQYSRMFRILDVVTDAGEEPKNIQRAISKHTRHNLINLLKNKRISKGNKARFLILGLAPQAYSKIFEAYVALI